MAERANHIISGCKWQTSFDKKEEAVRLQDRLSSWSEMHLPKELARVLDAVCPPGQTWHIESLEIDLGEIDYTDLERELTKKFYQQFSEKITNLLLHAGRGSNEIEIVSDQVSREQLISSFLLHGYMPWNYNSTSGSINEVLTNQLLNSHRSTVLMLKELAANHENVRKRLAWQVNEHIITRFVRVVETSNCACILSFTDALTTIQQKETIIQTGTSDFRKNLWLWILNYLFTERGTLFNKIAFLKSSIRQMADHYNIGYLQILVMIERAARQVSRQYPIKSDFLLTLDLLVKENQTDKVVIGKRKKNKVIQQKQDKEIKRRYLPQTVLQPMADINPVFTSLLPSPQKNNWQEFFQMAEEHQQLDELIFNFIDKQQLPHWVNSNNNNVEQEMLIAIATRYPDKLLQVLKQYNSAAPQIEWSGRLLPFGQLAQCIESTHPQQLPLLGMLEKLYTALGTLACNGITAKEVQLMLAVKVMRTWVNENWKSMAVEQIWTELIWEVCTKKGIAKADLLTSLQITKDRLPAALQQTLDKILARNNHYLANHATIKPAAPNNSLPKKTTAATRTSWPVKNAGLVLVSSYIPLLFQRLGLVEALGKKENPDHTAAYNAVHYLQYIVTGFCNTGEHLLTLNKLLCGVPLLCPVPGEIEMPDTHKTLISEMLLAIIGHWAAIGTCSINGFRGNWLVRDGLLTEQNDKWELTVEKRSYDILMNKSPFSFSIIKYPWMAMPLHVNWSY